MNPKGHIAIFLMTLLMLFVLSSCRPKPPTMDLDEMKSALDLRKSSYASTNVEGLIKSDNIFTVKQMKELVTISVTGTLQPKKHSLVNPKEDGTCVGFWHPDKRPKGSIGEILPGTLVQKGEVIVELQDYILDQQIINLETQLSTLSYGFGTDEVNEIEAALNIAELNYKRMQELIKKESVSQIQYDQAKMGYEQALAAYTKALLQIDALRKNLEILKKRRENLMVKAPFDGRIQKVYINPGEKAASMMKTTVFEIVDDSELDFTFGIPEEYSPFINKQTTVVKMNFADGTTASYPLSSVAPLVTQYNRNIECQVRIKNHDRKIQAGIFASADVTFTITGIFIPPSAVISSDDNYFCFVLDGKEFVKIPVKIGLISNSLNLMVLSGVLQENSKIIRNANDQLLSLSKITME